METLISPGVFLRENDLSQITQGPTQVGAAIVGPTVLGPVNLPTVVTSYSSFRSQFGALFVSGGNNYEYLTSIAAYNYFQQGGTTLLVTRVASGSGVVGGWTSATASIISPTGVAFTLATLGQGTVMNNDFSASLVNSSLLPSGSVSNIRWEITAASTGSGLFTLTIRRGNDYENSKTVLETWANLSLDPNQNNYISYVIGDQTLTPTQDPTDNSYYLQTSGSYVNQSNYIRVASVLQPTPNYFDAQGIPQSQYTGSIPTAGSGSANGSFGTAVGNNFPANAPVNLFTNIPNTSDGSSISSISGVDYTKNIQGVSQYDYNIALSLLGNKDQYDYKTIYAPGITLQAASSVAGALLTTAQSRGTAIAVVDTTVFGQNISTAQSKAQTQDNSYGATYWPWVQLASNETGKLFFCPASTIVPAVYEYSDKISAEWFAPAGLTRGGLTTVIQPERRLTVGQRDLLYGAKVNPIAVFPGQGTVIYGQKTLQAKASALDRVNVRRLLISLKRYIGGIANTLVFEQNTQTTRNSFLNQVNPYLQSVQQKQGLYAFNVVMDDTNNTPSVIDRNQLVGAIYLQPTKTAEYILLNFNILPSGATFGS